MTSGAMNSGASNSGTVSTGRESITGRLAELRDAFDQSFTEPPRRQVVEFDDLLSISVGDRRYALRLAQTSGLFPDRPITALPGPLPALLGVAVFAGAIVPVYELATVLGHPANGTPRWLVLARGEPAVALAFAGLDGHLQVAGGLIVQEADGQGGRDCLRGMVPLPQGARPIVDLPAVRSAIQAMSGPAEPQTTDTRSRVTGER